MALSAAESADVLIAGAGPTGLMLANQLVRHGVRPLIVDRNAGPSVYSKALGVQARTLEIYSRLGIAEQAIERGTCASGANMWVEGKKAARVPLGDIGRDLSPYPFLLILGQDENERLLGMRLREQGIDIEWGWELIGLKQDADHVVATLKQDRGATREVIARWVAGCDGARSAVRSLSDIEFRGAPYEHVFFVADARATGPMAPGELNVFLWRSGFHLFFPMRGPDRWRVVGILPPPLRLRDDLEFDALVPSIVREVGSTLEFHACHWFSTYRIHHRRAARFRKERCFLLGDAAHIHSPVGAQGMNTGLQDAYNLAWKLALVVRGRAADALLDSYETERVPVAERLLKSTDRAFALIVSDGWIGALFRTKILARVAAFAMTRDRIRQLAFRTISQIGIAYRDSLLSVTHSDWPDGAPRAGDRFPWLRVRIGQSAAAEDLYSRFDDTRFNLIVIGQAPDREQPNDFGGLVLVHRIAADPIDDRALERVQIPKPSYFLLRPDGHIGLCGASLSVGVLTNYLTEQLGLLLERAQ